MTDTHADDELKRIKHREADEAFFLRAWRTWRQGRTREEAEAKAAWLLANGAPVCAGVARRKLELEGDDHGRRERR